MDFFLADAWQQLYTAALGQRRVGILGGLIALPLLALHRQREARMTRAEHDRRNAQQLALFRNHLHGQAKPTRMDARLPTEPNLDARVVALVRAVIGLRTQQVADALQIKRSLAVKFLTELEAAGRIRRTRGGAWEVQPC